MLQEAKFDELAFVEPVVLKPEPDSSDSDDSGSGNMVIDHPFPMEGSSPVYVNGGPASHASAHYSNTDDTTSETSSFAQKRPYPMGVAGPSKRSHMETEDDYNQSIASSASEQKVFESRRKNNQASKRSRSNKKSRDTYNEHELQQLEDHNAFLLRKTRLLEEVRDKLRGMVTERVRR